MENLCQIVLVAGIIIPLFWLSKWFISFYDELIKNVGKDKVFIMHLADFYPRRIRRQLQEAHILRKKKETIEHLLKSYRWLLVAVTVYIAYNLVHITYTLYRIVQVIKNYSSIKDTGEFDFTICVICFSIVSFYCFLIAPIIKILFGADTFEKRKNDIFEFFKRIAFDIVVCILSFIFCKLWIVWAEAFVTDRGIKETILWIELAILMLYQYLILFLISGVIHLSIFIIDIKLNKVLSKKNKRNGFVNASVSYCKRYADKSLIYPALKNCTYLILVLVYALAIDAGPNGGTVAGATGILFLIDTFLDKDIEIGKRLNDNSENKHE